tara:strand:- start:891 stop:1073 length:183 start_codon:yes stop_codon:yes gene_type:complete
MDLLKTMNKDRTRDPRNPKTMNKKADSGVAVNAVARATVAVTSRSTPVFSATPSIVIDWL